MKFFKQSLIVVCLVIGSAAHAGPVDVNTADAATIAEELKGIGLSKAEAIVAYRDKHGRFSSIAELSQVKGIGARILEINQENIRLGDAD